MKPRFRWRTEDEYDWPDEGEAAVSNRYGRRSWWLLVLALIVGLSLLYWQQVRRARQVEQIIEQDVLAVHRTWLQAVTTGDVELLVQLLSREDILWAASQRRQLAQDVMLDRRPLGWQAVGESEVTAVELSPDWQKANVTLTQPYAGAGGASTFTLEQIRTYTFDGSRWLQSPLDDEFWGEMETFAGNRVSITYPARDVEWAERVGRLLNAELMETCLLAANCPDTAQILVEFTTSPQILTDLRDELTPVFSGRAYLLPAPSLVGTPQDEVGFQALYAGYTRRILHTFANQLASPLPLPRQDLMTLCFPPEGSEVHLFQYETAIDQWAELFPRRTFASISGLPDDGGVILQERFWGGDPTRLYLLRWQGGEETRLFDQAGGSWFYPPVGWTGMTAEPQLLVQGTAANQSNGLYHRLDWQNCDASGCTPTELSGFTVWSPNGRHTLVQIRSMLFLGDEAGRPLQELEKGFNPFWLNANSFAYIRYVNDESHQGMELVQTAVDAAQPPQRMIPEDADQPSFLFYAASNPANSNQIFIAAPDPDPRSSGYQIWELSANGSLTRRLTLDNKPFGYPSLLTPSGYPPFSFSPDGRYLVLTELAGEPVKSWQFYLVETATGATAVYDIPYPLYPARYPFYDWSADGRWLAIMDDGFVRLLAPDFDYERLITYDYDACFFVTWVNQ